MKRIRLGDSHRATVWLLVGMTAYSLFHYLVLPRALSRTGLYDLGWVSWSTLAMQAMTLILVTNSAIRARTPRARWEILALAYIVLVYLLREADYHRLFTVEHVTRPRFYLDPTAPVLQRLIAGLLMGAFLICVAIVLVRNARSILQALRARRPWAVALFLWGVALVGSQIVDQALRRSDIGGLLEEMLEATAAGLAVVTVLHLRANPRMLHVDAGRDP